LGNCHASGVAISEKTGKVFTVKEKDFKQFYPWLAVTWSFNLNGNQGNHYIGTMTWDVVNDPNGENFTVDKLVCVENGKK
jgi:hypothetical protein